MWIYNVGHKRSQIPFGIMENIFCPVTDDVEQLVVVPNVKIANYTNKRITRMRGKIKCIEYPHRRAFNSNLFVL